MRPAIGENASALFAGRGLSVAIPAGSPRGELKTGTSAARRDPGSLFEAARPRVGRRGATDATAEAPRPCLADRAGSHCAVAGEGGCAGFRRGPGLGRGGGASHGESISTILSRSTGLWFLNTST